MEIMDCFAALAMTTLKLLILWPHFQSDSEEPAEQASRWMEASEPHGSRRRKRLLTMRGGGLDKPARKPLSPAQPKPRLPASERGPVQGPRRCGERRHAIVVCACRGFGGCELCALCAGADFRRRRQ